MEVGNFDLRATFSLGWFLMGVSVLSACKRARGVALGCVVSCHVVATPLFESYPLVPCLLCPDLDEIEVRSEMPTSAYHSFSVHVQV